MGRWRRALEGRASDRTNPVAAVPSLRATGTAPVADCGAGEASAGALPRLFGRVRGVGKAGRFKLFGDVIRQTCARLNIGTGHPGWISEVDLREPCPKGLRDRPTLLTRPAQDDLHAVNVQRVDGSRAAWKNAPRDTYSGIAQGRCQRSRHRRPRERGARRDGRLLSRPVCWSVGSRGSQSGRAASPIAIRHAGCGAVSPVPVASGAPATPRFPSPTKRRFKLGVVVRPIGSVVDMPMTRGWAGPDDPYRGELVVRCATDAIARRPFSSMRPLDFDLGGSRRLVG